jgi:hypothetical protein
MGLDAIGPKEEPKTRPTQNPSPTQHGPVGPLLTTTEPRSEEIPRTMLANGGVPARTWRLVSLAEHERGHRRPRVT